VGGGRKAIVGFSPPDFISIMTIGIVECGYPFNSQLYRPVEEVRLS
jgi:hypothetical protein